MANFKSGALLDQEIDQKICSYDNSIVGKAFKEWVTGEVIDLNWEGFTAQDRVGARKLLRDFILTLESTQPLQP